MTVGVLGLGLIGGSIGLGLRDPSRRVLGCDPNPASCKLATERSCVDEVVDVATLAKADLVFVAVPPRAVISCLDSLSQHRGATTVITDVTSVKADVVAWAKSAKATYFVPGHPMAGHEKGTAQFASAWMFRNARWILCPEPKTDRAAIRLVEETVKALGARPVRITAAAHDQSVALYSHIPHALAGSLLTLAARLGEESVGGGSWSDLTRVGGVDPELWTQIFMGNREQIAKCLNSLRQEMETLEVALTNDDETAIQSFFRCAQEAKPR